MLESDEKLCIAFNKAVKDFQTQLLHFRTTEQSNHFEQILSAATETLNIGQKIVESSNSEGAVGIVKNSSFFMSSEFEAMSLYFCGEQGSKYYKKSLEIQKKLIELQHKAHRRWVSLEKT